MDKSFAMGIPVISVPLKLIPSLRHQSAPRALLWCASVSAVFLLLTFTVSPCSAVAQRPGVNSNPYLKNLASCSSDYDCDSVSTFLKCHNKVCMCPQIRHFDEDINRCLIRVGGSCTPQHKKEYCVANAICTSQGKSYSASSGMCKCKAKYKETIDNLCVSSSPKSHQLNFYLLLSLPLAAVWLAGQWK